MARIPGILVKGEDAIYLCYKVRRKHDGGYSGSDLQLFFRLD